MHHTRNAAVLVCLVLISLISIFAQTTKTHTDETTGYGECTTKQTCAECIRTPSCTWCSERRDPSKTENAPRPRCQNERSAGIKSQNSWCPKNMIVNPKPTIDILEAKQFSSDENKQVQITPQHVKMHLRRGQTETLKIRYKQAQDYPVDLYFLMDLSASMEDHKNNLSKLGAKLKAAMLRLTSNFHLGFGSFVDKVILPMTNTQTEWLANCKLKDKTTPCAPPYGYKTTMKLTNITDDFQKNVESAPISGNLDTAEGGLDAMMQAMVCWDQIGWRKNARHLLVYSSDATYHIAGDGRLAGLIEPNDEQCHMNADGFYTHAEILDYPSISQINKQARKNNMNIIFAVTKSQQSVYKDLSSYINASSTGILDSKSDTVVAIVLNEYQKLSNEIIMTDNASKILDLKYMSKCVNTDGRSPLLERKKCSGVRVNTILEFEVSIKAPECPENTKDWHQRIEIKPQGLNERVIVDIELLCDCPCSKPGNENFEPDSPMCSRSGDLTCGVCACKSNYFGQKCDCKGDNQQSAISKIACMDKNNKTCSEHGECICGGCICNPRPNKEEEFYGPLCECDNFSCQRINGQVCSGPSNGKCECGKCVCEPGWTREACDCQISNDTCIPPGENKTECNGFGECLCGKCNCKEGKAGKFCEICPTCPSQLCDSSKACVECRTHHSGPEYEKGKLCPNCGHIEFEDDVDDIDESPQAVHKEGTHVCPVLDSSGCTFVFTYMEKKENEGRGDMPIISVTAEKSKRCPEPAVSALGVAGGAIGITLFLGLVILLIWKLLTMFHDHREWVKFEKERVCANWERGENPLFKEPTTSFKNPTFDTKG